MQQSFNWDLLQSFLAVARTGKLTSAAKRLAIDHSTLSRRLTTLETSLGTKLFERHVSGYTLTVQGERLLERAEILESTVLGIQSDVGQSSSRVSGAVRIGAGDGFIVAFLAQVIGKLSDAHPDLGIDLVSTPRTFSLSRREADIVIGLSRPVHGRLHARLLTDYEYGVYGPRNKPELWQHVRAVDDLSTVPFVTYIEDLLYAPELDLIPEIPANITPRLRISGQVGQIQATIAGAGLCVLPCFAADIEPELVRVLPDSVHLMRTMWMSVHSDMRDLARIRVTAKFVADEVHRQAARFLPGLASGALIRKGPAVTADPDR